MHIIKIYGYILRVCRKEKFYFQSPELEFPLFPVQSRSLSGPILVPSQLQIPAWSCPGPVPVPNPSLPVGSAGSLPYVWWTSGGEYRGYLARTIRRTSGYPAENSADNLEDNPVWIVCAEYPPYCPPDDPQTSGGSNWKAGIWEGGRMGNDGNSQANTTFSKSMWTK